MTSSKTIKQVWWLLIGRLLQITGPTAVKVKVTRSFCPFPDLSESSTGHSVTMSSTCAVLRTPCVLLVPIHNHPAGPSINGRHRTVTVLNHDQVQWLPTHRLHIHSSEAFGWYSHIGNEFSCVCYSNAPTTWRWLFRSPAKRSLASYVCMDGFAGSENTKTDRGTTIVGGWNSEMELVIFWKIPSRTQSS